MNKDIVIDVNKQKDGCIEVSVELPLYDPRCTPVMHFTTADILGYLSTQGIKHGDCLNEASLCNVPPNAHTHGSWCFGKTTPPVKKVTKRAKKTIKKSSTEE